MHDVVLIHPPAIYDFRRKIIFPGPIAYTVRESTDQLIIPPIGMFSIADYLERNGYRVLIENLGDRMIYDESFDVERYLEKSEARVYAIGLHWVAHSQGAIEIAKLCKRFHSNSIVVLGGLTATIFHCEVLQKFDFVDAVIRGEAEVPLLDFINALEKHGEIKLVPNATIRDESGRIIVGDSRKSDIDINQLEFTRLDLMEPKRSFFSKYMSSHFCIPICRGCTHNCVTCGGSSYSYRVYLNRDKPSFRSPDKIIEDLEKLSEQGVKTVFLFQDPRMGGKKYCEELVRKIRAANTSLVHLSMELFEPADEEYIRSLSRIGIPLTLTISPESGVNSIRIAHGKNYTNSELFKTIESCRKYRDRIHLMVFFMNGLANETIETIDEMPKLWEKICIMDKGFHSVNFAFGPLILLDVGSLAFDHSEEFGYKLVFRRLEDYIKGMSMPSWHQWISYETKFLDRAEIANLTIELIEHSINLREKYGIYDRAQALRERIYYAFANKLIMKEVEKAMQHQNEFERQQKLKMLKEMVDKYLREIISLPSH